MNNNLYTKEIKRNRKNLIIWSAIVCGLSFLVLAIFPAMKGMGENLTGLMDSIPVELKRAMGLDDDTWQSILGFYRTYFGIYIVVLMGIYTGSTGATIISKEERDRTSEFLFTKPISRKELFLTKMASLGTLTLIIIVVQMIFATLGMLVFGQGTADWGIFLTMHVHGTSLIILFTGIGVLMSMFMNPKTNFMGPIVGIVFGSYFLDAIAKGADIQWLSYLSPYRYADFDIFNPEYSVNILSVFIMVLVGLGLVFAAYKVFEKKDLAA